MGCWWGAMQEEDNSAGDLECRICRAGQEEGDLIAPCRCSGSLRAVHHECLTKWITYRGRPTTAPLQATAFVLSNKSCELCGAKFHLQWRVRPWRAWTLPHVNHSERLHLHVLSFSYVLAAIDISYTVRWLFLPILHKHLSRSAIVLKSIWVMLTSATWMYIFAMHARFLYRLAIKWIEENVDVSIVAPVIAKGLAPVDAPVLQ